MDSIESTCRWFNYCSSCCNKYATKLNFPSNMSRCVVSRFCFRQIVFCCFLCVVSLLLFLNQPGNLNNYVSAVLADPPRTELMALEIQQMERLNLLQETCRNTTATNHQPNKRKMAAIPVRFKIEDRHRVMYCDVPKVASTNLKGLMLILSGQVETDDLSSIPRLTIHEQNPMRILNANNLNDTMKNGLGNFTKFIFVRHPFERLVSAYRDKLAGNDAFYKKAVGREIIRKYRQNPNQLSLETGHDVTFPEFVRFIVDEWRNGRKPLDVHWRPVVDLCRPCDMKFHFIGKFETLNQDVNFLLDKLNETDLSRLFAGQPTKPKTTSSLWKESMKQISHPQLSELNQMFADDFRLFGYPQYTAEK